MFFVVCYCGSEGWTSIETLENWANIFKFFISAKITKQMLVVPDEMCLICFS